jgi:hypothetical protein
VPSELPFGLHCAAVTFFERILVIACCLLGGRASVGPAPLFLWI